MKDEVSVGDLERPWRLKWLWQICANLRCSSSLSAELIGCAPDAVRSMQCSMRRWISRWPPEITDTSSYVFRSF